MHRSNVARAREALLNPEYYEERGCFSPFYFAEGKEPISTNVAVVAAEKSQCPDLRRYGAWSHEMKALNLPQYRTLYLFICRLPVDVIRESLCIRLEQKPPNPSPLSIRQLIQEFKVTILALTLRKSTFA